MKSTLQVCGLLLVWAIGLLACTNSAKKNANEIPEKPNIFLFLADDLGKADLGFSGNQFVKTPSIDFFAQNAIEFSNMYTPTAMCAPSRSALYTGLYPHANGCHMNHGSTYDSIESLPSYLKKQGYHVALVNKRHIKPESVYPFDYLKTGQLEDYLENNAPPFCIIYASDEPHGPHVSENLSPDSVIIPPKWVDTKATRNGLAGYYKDIEILDGEFQNFLQVIQKNKLDNKAVTIFTSDHGYEYFAKWSCYEAGLKVPFFLKTNGFAFETKEVAALSSFVDVLPTFIELAGGTVPQGIDGKSFIPLLSGADVQLHQYIYGAHTTRGIYSGTAYPIRSISDGKYKYIRNLNAEQKFQNILTNGWNFGDASEAAPNWKEWLALKDSIEWVSFYQLRPYEELYSLEEDPNELVNLADQKEYKQIKQALKRSMEEWMLRQNDEGMPSEMKVPLKRRDEEG